jgi:hypothetical protein
VVVVVVEIASWWVAMFFFLSQFCDVTKVAIIHKTM